jgi:DNA-binding transcriptional MerR regulator
MPERQAREQAFTIQHMAQASGLIPPTLRNYERAGLMWPQVERDEGSGYRS